MELKALLETGAAELEAALARVIWDNPTANQSWNARDVLAHLAGAERGMQMRIARATTGDSALPADFDLDRWNARQVERRRGLTDQELASELRETRANTIELLGRLEPGQLDAPLEHPLDRNATIGWVFRRIVEHQREHLSQIG